jgi:hypothetical protein
MSRLWGKTPPPPEPEKSGRRRGGRKGGRRRGESDYDPANNDSTKPENQPKVANHQTYLDAKGGAKVSYVNCLCDQNSDHSRGTY